MRRIGLVLLLSCGFLTSCGSANVNRLFGMEDESYSSLLQRAQFAYDDGEFSLAAELANKAYGRAENNGDAGVLLGNIHLSQAGIDIFQLVGKLSTLSSSSSSSGSTTSKCKSSSGATQSASSVLTEMSCLLLTLSDADKSALGTDVTSYNGLKAIGVPSVYIPNEVNDDLRSKVGVLGALDKGIRALCPFIDRTKVLASSIDERHKNAATCPDRTKTSFSSPKAHISFALLHLVEALVFQQGVLIDAVSSGETRTGVQTISTKMSSVNTGSVQGVANLALAAADLANVIGKVFDTGNSKSQIALALNSLIMVSQSFEAAGVPSSVTSVITTQLTNLQKTASALPGTGSSTTKQTQALSGQINQAYAASLAQKIEQACPTASTAGCSDNKASLCAGFTSISQGVDSSKVSTPTLCK
jgi:hypothetical protein